MRLDRLRQMRSVEKKKAQAKWAERWNSCGRDQVQVEGAQVNRKRIGDLVGCLPRAGPRAGRVPAHCPAAGAARPGCGESLAAKAAARRLARPGRGRACGAPHLSGALRAGLGWLAMGMRRQQRGSASRQYTPAAFREQVIGARAISLRPPRAGDFKGALRAKRKRLRAGPAHRAFCFTRGGRCSPELLRASSAPAGLGLKISARVNAPPCRAKGVQAPMARCTTFAKLE